MKAVHVNRVQLVTALLVVQSGSDLEYGMTSAVELVVYILEAQLGENGVVEHLPDSIHIHRSMFGVFAYALWNSAHLLLGSLLRITS